MTLPIQVQIINFFKFIHNDKTGSKIMENYQNHINVLNYILRLSDDDIPLFYKNNKIYIDMNEYHIKQIKNYAVETTDSRPPVFKLAYGLWLYTHTQNLI